MKYFFILIACIGCHIGLIGQTTSKNSNSANRFVMYLITVSDQQKTQVFYTGTMEIKAKGFVDLRLRMNKLKQCLICEAGTLYPMLNKLSISEFEFFSTDEAAKYFSEKIHPEFNLQLFSDTDCTLQNAVDNNKVVED